MSRGQRQIFFKDTDLPGVLVQPQKVVLRFTTGFNGRRRKILPKRPMIIDIQERKLTFPLSPGP